LSTLFGWDGVEKFVARPAPACDSDLCYVCRRFDAERLHAVRLETFQQAPVIAGDLHYQVARSKSERLDDCARVLAVVRGDCLRCAGDIEVVTEENLGINHVQNLDKRTAFAEIDVERMAQLPGDLVPGPEKRVGKRLRAERQESAEPLSPTGPAGCPFVVDHHSFRSDFQPSNGSSIGWERGALHFLPPPFRETECKERREEFPAGLHSDVGKSVAAHSSKDVEFDDPHP